MDSLVEPKDPLYASPALQLAAGLGAPGLLLSLLLFSVVTLRARMLSRWGGWLVILTVPLGVVAAVLVLFIGTSLAFQGIGQGFIGGVLGLGLVARGWALWSEKTETVAQVKLAM